MWISEETADGAADRRTHPFAELIRDQMGPDFVVREWLQDKVDAATEAHGYVLVTGEPGAGKTSLLAGMAHRRPDLLCYFVRRDSRDALVGGDIQSFLLSVGHQLARRRPELFRPDRLAIVVRQHIDKVAQGGRAVGIRIDDLTTSPFHRTAVLELEQRVAEVSGTATAIEIGYAGLEPRLLEPDNLAHLALLGPAESLLAEDPSARIVILLDALDELTGEHGISSLLRWLADGAELPANVRIVITSRPHPQLEMLRSARAGRLAEIAIDPDAGPVLEDLSTYARLTLGAEPVAEAARSAGLFLDQFQRDVVRMAAGNFLYLATYARALHDAVAEGTAADAELFALDRIPSGLEGLYTYFVDRIQAAISQLGMLDVADPLGPGDTLTPAWEGVGQPILGVLAVAEEALTVDELVRLAGIRVWPRSVRNVLARLRWLLDQRGDRITFYHASIGEFLTGESLRLARPDRAVDAREWHERIVRHYRGAAASWEDLEWETVDRYGLAHLGRHLLDSREVVADEATDLVGPGLRRACRTMFGSDRRFLVLIDLIVTRLLENPSPATHLPKIVHLGVARRQLLRSGHSISPAVVGLMARMGRTAEAVEHVAALAPSLHQFEAMREIVRHAPVDSVTADLRDMLVECALTVPDEEILPQRAGRYPPMEYPVRSAALDIAAHDLARALRLWERVPEEEASFSGRDDSADPVYRVAAAASDIPQARSLIESIRFGRARDYLDLADRSSAEQIPDLLRAAEQTLADTTPDDRLRCHARLARAWATVPEPDRAAAHLERLRAHEVDDPVASARGLTDAAMELVEYEPETARALLVRLSNIDIDGRNAPDMVRAARLWVLLGSPDTAVELLGRWSQWDFRGAVSALAEIDRSAAFRMITDKRRKIEPDRPEVGFIDRRHEDSVLSQLAEALAGLDVLQAEEVAKEVTNTTWSPLSSDRYTELASVGHRCLDADDPERARALLDECLRFAERAPALVDPAPIGPFRKSRATTPNRMDEINGVMFVADWAGEWRRRLETRFFYRPEDWIRAATPWAGAVASPHSWARTVRILTEWVAPHDLPRAVRSVEAIVDGPERTVGYAGLFRNAAGLREDASAHRLWTRFTAALAEMDCYEWTYEAAAEDLDPTPLAYLRPDHYARFEAAVQLVPNKFDFGHQLLRPTPALHEAAVLTFCHFGSLHCLQSAITGQPPDRMLEGLHVSALAERPDPEQPRGPLYDITYAMAAVCESMIDGRTGRRWTSRPPQQIEDPLYAALADLRLSSDRRSARRAFADSMRSLMTPNRLPAVAGLLAHLVEMPGAERLLIRDLSTEVVARAGDQLPGNRIAALLPFAESERLADLAEPVELSTLALRSKVYSGLRGPCVDALARLFPVLLARAPAVALRQLYDALPDDWALAMAQLESGARPLVDILGPDAVAVLHAAIQRGESVVRGAGQPLSLVDGVDFTAVQTQATFIQPGASGPNAEDSDQESNASRTSRTDSDAEAAYLLARTAHENGDLAEAEHWYHEAATAGDIRASNNLAVLLHERGDRSGAEHWYRRAAAAGDDHAMYNLGRLLDQNSERAEAERWFQAAAEAGHIPAMNNFGRILEIRGDLTGAETWYDRGATAGDPTAMNNLAWMRAGRGDLEAAERWYTRAADCGDTVAMSNLVRICTDRGDLEAAERWARRAAATGEPAAMTNLATVLTLRGDSDGAEEWNVKAADAGDAGAMSNLARSCLHRGDLDAAEQWCEKAVAAGDTEAADALLWLRQFRAGRSHRPRRRSWRRRSRE
ncbi:tetratricopeptide repeat protein [Nocardia mexicana]|uniref:tetratricopeptide repeat protein n=1 Tax=Nocardia mexicana TaxID=279262 RepID=UPI00082BFD28|nr:tetratricopeptide repeat protein [Nocardia mexicana]